MVAVVFLVVKGPSLIYDYYSSNAHEKPSNDKEWCESCFLTIEASDISVFLETGLCKKCTSKSLKNISQLKAKPVITHSAEWEMVEEVMLRKGAEMVDNIGGKLSPKNSQFILFVTLFLIPPVDFLIFDSVLPHEFFLLLRLIAFLGFALMAYIYKDGEKLVGEVNFSIIFLGLSLVYNPFVPVELGREIWTFVNIATSGLLVYFKFLSITPGKARSLPSDEQTPAIFFDMPQSGGAISRNFVVNYDRDVIAPLKLLREKISDQDFRDNYGRIVDEFTIGYVHGFMAFATIQNHTAVRDYDKSFDLIHPLSGKIFGAIFSQKELVDLQQGINPDITKTNRWQQGFEWGVQGCDMWQVDGEVTLIWIDYIRSNRDEVFKASGLRFD